MKQDTRFFPILLFIISILAISCVNDPDEIKDLLSLEQSAMEEAIDVDLIYSDSGIVRVHISGPRLIRHIDKNDPRQEFTEGVVVEFYDNEKKPSSWLTAKYGIRLENKNIVVVKDSVVLYNMQGDTLKALELIWSEKEEIITSDDFVLIKTGGEIITGYGFKANQDFTRYELNTLEGTLQVEGLAEKLDDEY